MPAYVTRPSPGGVYGRLWHPSAVTAIVERPALLYPGALLLAALYGALAASEPKLALAALAGAVVVRLAWHRPVGSLIAIIGLTAVVPYGIQKLAGISRPGLLLSDVLLLVGMAWGLLAAWRIPLDRRWMRFGAALGVYLVFALLQLVHGIRSGAELSQAGFEFRIQLGFGAFFLAVPLLRDPVARARLWKGLLIVALALGLWGVYQYVGKLPFSAAQDYGVREGVAHTANGRGQVQGGLYGFGVAVVLCTAALLSGALSLRARRWVLVVLVLNGAGLLLTFERTFWVATVFCAALVIVRAGHVQRVKALVVVPLLAIVGLVGLSLVAPGELATARERLLSIGQAASSDSIRYRIVESRHVLDLIEKHPVAGSGFGAKVYWGRPWQRVRPRYYTYTHNGYLWIAWKLGIPAAVLLLLLIAAAVAMRAPPAMPPLERAMRNGAQGGLLMLLIASATFPSFNTQAITAVMGLLLAVSLLPPRAEPDVRVAEG